MTGQNNTKIRRLDAETAEILKKVEALV